MVEFRPFCGNSSVVEHDLAKVGVASSNLVSRSILFLLLFISSLFSQPLYIDKTYCIEEDTLNASFFGYKSNDDFVIIQIPKERIYYSVPTSTIRSAFNDANITFIDSSDGVVIFKRNCNLMGKADALEEAFVKKFQEASPFVIIEGKPRISAKSSLPADFKRFVLTDVHISDAMLKKNSGSFLGIFKVNDREKKLYFSYEMDAKATVFKAKHNLLNGKILTNDDYESLWINLDALPARAILNEIPQNSVIKITLKKDSFCWIIMLMLKKRCVKKILLKHYIKKKDW